MQLARQGFLDWKAAVAQAQRNCELAHSLGTPGFTLYASGSYVVWNCEADNNFTQGNSYDHDYAKRAINPH